MREASIGSTLLRADLCVSDDVETGEDVADTGSNYANEALLRHIWKSLHRMHLKCTLLN